MAAFGLAVTLCGQAADQFVLVTDPGWENSSQNSWNGAWGDYDHDGFIDLFVPNTSRTWGDPSPNFLYRNNGNGTFTLQTDAQVGAVASDEDASAGAYWADANNDGLLDLLVMNFIISRASLPVQTRLYLNQGNGAFRSADAGDLSIPSYFGGWGAWADYDNDGWLDVFACAAWSDGGHRTNLLYRGVGDGNFRLVTNNVVATDRSNLSNDAAWGDFDNDGKLDLFISSALNGRDFLYHNDGHGQFTRLVGSVPEQYLTFHASWGDYNNDGLLDLAGSGASGTRLLRNSGVDGFQVATNWLSADTGMPLWGDYDNDGYLDLLVAHGAQIGGAQIALFHSDRNGMFSQVSDVVTRRFGAWITANWGDYDNDGFLDLFAADEKGDNALYHNLGNTNHWIKFQLQGTGSNRSAIGAKVRVKATIGGKTFWQMREISGNNLGQDGLRPHFGLGDATNVDLVRIEWPSGPVQELRNVASRQLLRVTEPAQLAVEGARTFGIRSWRGQAFVVQTSNDLLRWSSLATVTNLNGTLGLTDTSATSSMHVFYRVLSQ